MFGSSITFPGGQPMNQWPPQGGSRWRQPPPPPHQKPWRQPPPRGYGPGPGMGPRPRFGDVGGPRAYRPPPQHYNMGPVRPRMGGPPHSRGQAHGDGQRSVRPTMDMRFIQNQDMKCGTNEGAMGAPLPPQQRVQHPPRHPRPPHQFGAGPHFQKGPPRYGHPGNPDSWT